MCHVEKKNLFELNQSLNPKTKKEAPIGILSLIYYNSLLLPFVLWKSELLFFEIEVFFVCEIYLYKKWIKS